jgi:hypothetical protein
MAQQILSDYLAEIARIRATRAGTGEISYYGALTGALNTAGERLKPRVFCVPNLRNRGSGFPDMGLFVAARGMPLEAWSEARAPERGVVEVDDIPADLSVKSGSAQVRRYLAAYGLVRVTNYRDFVLLGCDARGSPSGGRASASTAPTPPLFSPWHAAHDVRRASPHASPSSSNVCCCTRHRSRRLRSGGRLSDATLYQFGQLGDEALACGDCLPRQLRRQVGAGAGFVISNGLEVVGEAEEAAQLVIDARVILYEPMKFHIETSMRFYRATSSIGDQRLSGMEAGEVGRAARRLVIVHHQHAVGFAEQPARFSKEISRFGRQRSTPSRRISRISGVRWL